MSIVIKAKHNGFRRCGIAHSSQPTKYADDFFTEEQLKALAKEPQLICAYEEDEFNLVQGEPDENLLQAAIPQAPDAAPASQSQAIETVIAPVVASEVDAADEVLVDGVPGVAGAAPVLVCASDDATGPLSAQAVDVAVATVQPVEADASEPAAKVVPVDAKPEKVRAAKPKDSTK